MKRRSNACGCCEGVEKLTPMPTANRPGLATLMYRIGTHATFFETMLARLTTLCLGDDEECGKGTVRRPLQALKTRSKNDPSIALLDSWALVADVLTFYQERIANEGYLRTAAERRSVLELARLVGYKLRPGVSSSVYLAYTLDDNFKDEVVIPKGSRVQSLSGPGEMPQAFETSEDCTARAAWNNLKPRTSRPQNITLDNAMRIKKVYLQGTKTNLKLNDPLLFVFGEGEGNQVIRIVRMASPDYEKDLTEASLQDVPFLVIAAVDILRFIFMKVNEFLEKAGLSSPTQSWFEIAKIVTGLALESLSLGSYPPIHKSYFSHDRFYRYLVNPAAKKTMALRKDSVNAWISGKVVALTNFETVPLPGDDANVRSFIGEVFDYSRGVLKNEGFRHELLCLVRHIAEQLKPSGPAEKTAFQGLLAAMPAIEAYVNNLIGMGKTIPQILALFNELSSILRDKDFREDIEALLDLLIEVANEKNKKILENVKIWLNTIPVNTGQSHCGAGAPIVTSLSELTGPLLAQPSLQPINSVSMVRSMSAAFGKSTDIIPRILTGMQPRLSDTLYKAWAKASVETEQPQLKSVHSLRLTAPLFGNNAQVKITLKNNTDLATKDAIPFIAEPDGDWTPSEAQDEGRARLYLDIAYEGISPGSHVVIRIPRSWESRLAAVIESVTIKPRTAYGISGKTTQLELSRKWWEGSSGSMERIRKASVWVETEAPALAEEPWPDDVAGDAIELSALYDGIESGRWVIVAGERSDVSGTSGVHAAELAMVSAVQQLFDKKLPGDRTHSLITLAEQLAYRYKRDTVTIYGNVVKATHGESRREMLGSGDGTKDFQFFTLKQAPLTFVSASNPSGVDSTLKVYINDVQWHETDSLAGASARDRSFITKTDDQGNTSISFGNGREGARLPTGVENVRAEYRSGIGKPGNVKAGQISLLMTRPLGVKEVVNPMRASGGSDRETRDQARKNAQLAVTALDRLVSVKDYADFARTYAGIGKACARELSDGRRQIVHVTIAGANNIPIDETSDLYRNLHQALLEFGDPYQPVQLAVRELMFIVVSARIRVLPDYQWESVEPKVRTALLDAFSFERRELGQNVVLSEVISVIQNVLGVAFVDVDKLRGIPEKIMDKKQGIRRMLTSDEISAYVTARFANKRGEIIPVPKGTVIPSPVLPDRNKKPIQEPLSRISVNLADIEDGVIRPAQLAFLTPDIPDTLILNHVQ